MVVVEVAAAAVAAAVVAAGVVVIVVVVVAAAAAAAAALVVIVSESLSIFLAGQTSVFPKESSLKLDVQYVKPLACFSMAASSSSSSRLCPSTAGCSPPSMSSIVVCLLPS